MSVSHFILINFPGSKWSRSVSYYTVVKILTIHSSNCPQPNDGSPDWCEISRPFSRCSIKPPKKVQSNPSQNVQRFPCTNSGELLAGTLLLSRSVNLSAFSGFFSWDVWGSEWKCSAIRWIFYYIMKIYLNLMHCLCKFFLLCFFSVYMTIHTTSGRDPVNFTIISVFLISLWERLC